MTNTQDATDVAMAKVRKSFDELNAKLDEVLDRSKKFLLSNGCPADEVRGVLDRTRVFDVACAQMIGTLLNESRKGIGTYYGQDVSLTDYFNGCFGLISECGDQPPECRWLDIDTKQPLSLYRGFYRMTKGWITPEMLQHPETISQEPKSSRTSD